MALADAQVLVWNNSSGFWENKSLSADLTMDAAGVVTVAATHAGTPHHAEAHTAASHSDQSATGAQLTNLVDASDAEALHVHPREFSIDIFGSGTPVSTGDGTRAFAVPALLDGFELTAVLATVHDKGITDTTDVVLRRRRAGVDADMLSTPITIGDEFFAADGAIDAGNDDLATGDNIYVDVDAVHSGTAPNGLSVVLTFTKP